MPREIARSYRPSELFAIALAVTLAVAAGAKALELPRRLAAGEIARADDLNANFDAIAGEIETLRARVDALEADLAATGANPSLALGPYVRVEEGPLGGLAGPHVIFEGANVHVRSGAGATDEGGAEPLSGLGNLVVGYDALGAVDVARTGAHNLVVGDGHGFTSHGGLVVGREHRVEAPGAVALGGARSIADGEGAAVVGGWGSAVSGAYASISGGRDNTASAPYASVSGGRGNAATGAFASVGGGQSNEARGEASAVAGGLLNVCEAPHSAVLGGLGNGAEAAYDTVVGDPGQVYVDTVAVH